HQRVGLDDGPGAPQFEPTCIELEALESEDHGASCASEVHRTGGGKGFGTQRAESPFRSVSAATFAAGRTFLSRRIDEAQSLRRKPGTRRACSLTYRWSRRLVATRPDVEPACGRVARASTPRLRASPASWTHANFAGGGMGRLTA